MGSLRRALNGHHGETHQAVRSALDIFVRFRTDLSICFRSALPAEFRGKGDAKSRKRRANDKVRNLFKPASCRLHYLQMIFLSSSSASNPAHVSAILIIVRAFQNGIHGSSSGKQTPVEAPQRSFKRIKCVTSVFRKDFFRILPDISQVQ